MPIFGEGRKLFPLNKQLRTQLALTPLLFFLRYLINLFTIARISSVFTAEDKCNISFNWFKYDRLYTEQLLRYSRFLLLIEHITFDELANPMVLRLLLKTTELDFSS